MDRALANLGLELWEAPAISTNNEYIPNNTSASGHVFGRIHGQVERRGTGNYGYVGQLFDYSIKIDGQPVKSVWKAGKIDRL